MSTTDDQVKGMISQRAADWFVANRAGMTPEQRQSFTDWLKTSPVHVQEYLAIAVIGRDLREACTVSARSIEALIERARNEEDSTVETLWPRNATTASIRFSRAWKFTAVALSVAVLVVSGLLIVRNFDVTSTAPVPDVVTTLHYETAHGTQHSYVLADNSVVHLNTDSDVTIRYSPTQRTVSLNSGEAVFEVTHDSARPFQVIAKSAQIIDLGTKFDVRLNEVATVVTVVEGRVEVRSSSAAEPRGNGLQLTPGQQVSVTDGGLPFAPVAVDAERATAWLHRQISFDREPLERVASEINRYASKSIEITTPALKGLRVSGMFTTDDTSAFIAFLRSLDGVQVEETPTQILVFKRSDRKAIR
jgi:transmembrane sensor